MSWKTIEVEAGSKLCHIYNFSYMHKTAHFSIEINEFLDGVFAGYAEHSTDKNFLIDSVDGKSTKECLEKLIKRINERMK